MKQEQRDSSIKEKDLCQGGAESCDMFLPEILLHTDTGVLSFNSVEACETCASKTCHTKHHGLTLQLPRKSGIYTPDQIPIQIYF